MKMIHFSRISVIFFSLLLASLYSFSQNASLSIWKNGARIDPDDMSIGRRDKLVVQILNVNANVKYKISNLNMEVRTYQYQQIKSQRQAAKYHKNITLNTDFEQNPKIEINVREYVSKYVSRILLKFILVEQLKEGESTRVDWITYGKEYEFWYY